MKFKATFHLVEIDKALWLKKLKEEAAEKLAQMAVQYIVSATETIPKWSGASHMTFLALAREVSFSVDTSSVSVTPFWDSIVARNRSQASRGNEGSIEIDERKGRFVFTYATELPHLVYNESNNANSSPDQYLMVGLRQPGPYGFADKAVEAAFKDIKVELPPVTLKTSLIRV